MRLASSTVLAVLLTAVLVATAPPARATSQPRLPADAVEVAGPSVAGMSIWAWTRGDRVCTVVVREDWTAEEDEGDCREPTVTGVRGAVLFDEVGGRGRHVVAGIAGAQVGSAELAGPRAAPVRVPTVPSQLSGVGAPLRFFLVDAAEDDRAAGLVRDELRLRDASGAVRQVLEVSDVRDRPRALGTISRGRGWRLTARIEHRLAPTPLAPKRRAAMPCVRLRVDGLPWDDVCVSDADEVAPLVIDPVSVCPGAAVTVVASRAAARVVIITGDGRRRPVALRRIPASGAALRAGALVLGPDVAVRAVAALDRDGHRLSRLPVEAPPGRAACSTAPWKPYFGAYGPAVTAPTVPSTSALLTAHDDGDEVCVGTEGSVATCGLPPVAPEDVAPWVADAADGRLALALVPADVAGGELRLDDGRRVAAAVEALQAYAGRYGAVTRLLRAAVPAGRRVVGVRLHDPDGRTLWADSGPELPPLLAPATVLRRGDVPPLQVAGWRRMHDDRPSLCLGFAPLRRIEDCMTTDGPAVAAVARCAPRRLLVLGHLARRGDRLVVRLADDRAVLSRAAAIPRGTPGAHGRVGYVVLPAGAAIRRVELRGSRSATISLRLPPAARQCGYRLTVEPDEVGEAQPR